MKELDYRAWVRSEVFEPIVKSLEAAPPSVQRDAALAQLQEDPDRWVEHLVGLILQRIGPGAPRPALGPAERAAIDQLRADPEIQALLAKQR